MDSAGADALPLQSFTLSRLFADYGTTGLITLLHYQEQGGSSGSIARAEALTRAGTSGTLEICAASSCRILPPGIRKPTRKKERETAACQPRGAVGDDVADLKTVADALVAVRLLTRSRDSLEVAQEALLRQPPISDWIQEARDFLVWRDRLGREHTSFEGQSARIIERARAVNRARNWLELRETRNIAPADRKFILDSVAEDEQARQWRRLRRQTWQMTALVGVLFLGIGAGIPGRTGFTLRPVASNWRRPSGPKF